MTARAPLTWPRDQPNSLDNGKMKKPKEDRAIGLIEVVSPMNDVTTDAAASRRSKLSVTASSRYQERAEEWY
jgi:hypothetical protein